MKPASLMLVALAWLGTVAAAPAPIALETVAQVELPPGNITVTHEGRVVVSAHPSFKSDLTAIIFDPGGKRRDVVIHDEDGLVHVLAVRADEDETVWMLSGMPGLVHKRLYQIDARTGQTRRVITVDPAATVPGSFLNDIAIDRKRGLLYLSDPARGDDAAIVIVSEATGAARRVLQGHPSVRAGADPIVIDGKVVGSIDASGKTAPLLGGVNPITIDAKGEWLYYGPFSGRELWRIATADLADPTLGDAVLASRIHRAATKNPSAGITIDDAGRLYVTDPGARGIGVTGPAMPYRLLVQDARRLDWPDGMAVGDDGYVYVCANGLYRRSTSHKGDPGGGPPFFLTRFRALGPTHAGR